MSEYFTELKKYREFRDISNKSIKLDDLTFILTNCDVALANVIRRVILSEIPTLAFDDQIEKTLNFLYKSDKEQLLDSITICKNSTAIHNEFIAHRLSLVPLKIQKHFKIETYFDNSNPAKIDYVAYVDSSYANVTNNNYIRYNSDSTKDTNTFTNLVDDDDKIHVYHNNMTPKVAV